MTSNVSLRRCVCRVKLARKTDESASDVVGYGVATRVINNEGVPQIQYIDRVVDIPECMEKVISAVTRGPCVPVARDVRIELFPWIDRQR